MSIARCALPLLFAFGVSACITLPDSGIPKPGPKPDAALVKAPASSGEAVDIARAMSKRGRWGEALSYLDAVEPKLREKATLHKGRALIAGQWERERRALEDEILVGDAENLRNKVAVSEKLSLGDPDDLVLASRRIYWNNQLNDRSDDLVGCAEVHVADHAKLAKRCFDVASELSLEDGEAQRLAIVDTQLRTIASVAAERRRVNKVRERKARAKVLLNNAKAAIENQDYRKALDALATVEKLRPNNAEVAGLRAQAKAMLNPQVDALLKLGDHLYLDEQLDAALATWQAALALKPNDEEIVSRIERAKTVLDKLETLRQQQ